MAFILAMSAGHINGAHSVVVVQVDTSKVSATLDERYLSFTMDAGFTAHWGEMRESFWYNTTARALASHMGPCYLRFGGTSGDFTNYDFPSPSSSSSSPSSSSSSFASAAAAATTTTSSLSSIAAAAAVAIPPPPPPRPRVDTQTLNATIFDGLMDFAAAVNWSIIFGANALVPRFANNNTWNPQPFLQLAAYVRRRGYVLAGWELGNEPDLFPKHEAYTVSPEQLARDFVAFRAAANSALKLSPSSSKSSSHEATTTTILGPDTAESPADYFANFTLASAPLASSDVFTWHFYYGPGSSRPHGLPGSNFSHPDVLDKFLRSALEARTAWDTAAARAKASKQPVPRLWVGETSSTYGGGTSNASASFIAGYMWLDKLGIAARTGNTAVLRQTFGHSSYAVVGSDNLPNPDYWTSLLWQRLIGTRVLSVAGDTEPGRKVRVYAFCSSSDSSNSGDGGGGGGSGGITLVVLNTGAAETAIEVTGAPGLNSSVANSREAYLLTSYPNQLFSRDVFLNGEPLKLVDEARAILPNIEPRVLAKGDTLMVPGYSYGFVVFPQAAISACL